jgi:hypothetical protein
MKASVSWYDRDMKAAQPHLTYPELRLMPDDGKRYELIEVLSPFRQSYDRVTKLEQYALHGVTECWVVDPFAESIEIYVLVGSRYELKGAFAGDDILQSSLLPGWEIPAGNLFSL